MRHAKRSQTLSRPTDQRDALLGSLVRSLVTRDQIRTTHARAKEAQRLADRLVTYGKDGSIHARRKAFQILGDRDLVKRLFGEVAPRFVDCPGGYTRVVRLGTRRGDGAELALLAFSRLPKAILATVKAPEAGPKKGSESEPESAVKTKEETPEETKPKKFLEGLRTLWKRKQ